MNSISSDDWEKISELAGDAISLDVDERARFLKNIEDKHPAWKKELDSLLKHMAPDSDFLEKPAHTLLSFGNVMDDTSEGIPLLADGEVIADFEIREKLGEGAFATVYRARQISLGRDVALKVSRNMGHEAQTMANLEHANIVQVFSESIDDKRNVRYLCMQFVPGLTLEAIISRHEKSREPLTGASILKMIDEAMPAQLQSFDRSAIKERDLLSSLGSFETVLWLGNQLSRALGFAHSRGVLHLDVKPSNILVSGYGRALLSDFNVSVTQQIDTKTAPVVLGGTLNYMSAEHKKAFLNSADSIESLDHRADIFSLGVVLKEVLKVTSLGDEPKLAVDSLKLLLSECTMDVPEQRIQKTSDLSKRLTACSEYRSVLTQLPPGKFYYRMAEKHPINIYALCVLIPQIIGSVVNIFYNESRIMSHLSLTQEHFFFKIIYIWNPIVFTVCISLLTLKKRPIYRFILHPDKVYAEGIDGLAKLRARILSYPWYVTIVTSAGWLIASLMFPTMIHFFSSPVSSAAFWHFQLSFFLSWLIATTYSFTSTHYFGLRMLYPKLWVGCTDVRKTAKAELFAMGQRVRPINFLAGLVPLVGAGLMVIVGPESLQGHTYQVFQILLLSFVAMAILGLFYAVVATRQLSETLFALTGHEFRQDDE